MNRAGATSVNPWVEFTLLHTSSVLDEDSPDHDQESIIVALDDRLDLSAAVQDRLRASQREGQPICELGRRHSSIGEVTHSSVRIWGLRMSGFALLFGQA